MQEKPQRNIPNLKADNLYIYPILGDKKPTTKNYLAGIEKFERHCEIELQQTFRRIDIKGKVKTDPYSLPHTHEIKTKLYGTGFSNAFAFYEVARPIVKELMVKNIYKIRFYFFINLVIVPRENPDRPDWYIEYAFRYHFPSSF